MANTKMTDPPRDGPSWSAQPYLNWAIRTQLIYLRQGVWLPLLVQFVEGVTLERFSRSVAANTDHKTVFIPAPFRRIDAVLPDTFKFCVVLVLANNAKDLTTLDFWRASVLRSEMGPPVNLIGPGEETAEPSAVEMGVGPAERVVTGVIDEGIAFAHPRFRRHDTRCEFVWLQDASGVVSPGMPGIEITANQINAALFNATTNGHPEESVYGPQALKVLDMAVEGYKPLARRHSHGTHVLDMASGYEPGGGAPEKRPIIAVEMPEAAVGDPAGSTLSVHAAWGLAYILWRAKRLRRPREILPVVVNISYGPHEGPHDGSATFEMFMDELTRDSALLSTPMRVVLAAGNYRQSRTHARFRIDPAACKTIHWRLQPCGLTPSFMEIYFPTGAAVSATLNAPDGTSTTIDTGMIPNSPDLLNSLPPSPYGLQYVNTGQAQSCFLISVHPTAQDFAADVHFVAPSGVWTIEVCNVSGSVLSFDAWIKRSDTPNGRRAKGRQSYFDDPAYRRYDESGKPLDFDQGAELEGIVGDSYVQRRNTLSGIATGCQTFVIGSYRRGRDPADQLPSFYSSEASGVPVPGRMMMGINWLAAADDAPACPGALGAGTHSNTRVAMSGTSVASPLAVRYCSDVWLATGYQPGPIPPTSDLDAVSARVPGDDRMLVAGAGLMRLRPPFERGRGERP